MGQTHCRSKLPRVPGADGNSADPRFPKPAGQSAAYIYWQLWPFKRGTRGWQLSVSAFSSPASVRGQRRHAPWPARAGGMPMMMTGMVGMSANVPNLSGQHADYIVDQLTRFASGARPATVMGRIAAVLSEEDRRAVADCLAGSP